MFLILRPDKAKHYLLGFKNKELFDYNIAEAIGITELDSMTAPDSKKKNPMDYIINVLNHVNKPIPISVPGQKNKMIGYNTVLEATEAIDFLRARYSSVKKFEERYTGRYFQLGKGILQCINCGTYLEQKDDTLPCCKCDNKEFQESELDRVPLTWDELRILMPRTYASTVGIEPITRVIDFYESTGDLACHSKTRIRMLFDRMKQDEAFKIKFLEELNSEYQGD